MAQRWSQQPGATGVWHLATEITPRPTQANSWVAAACGRQFPEKLTQPAPVPGDPVCPTCQPPQ